MSVSFLTIMKPKMNIPKHWKKPKTIYRNLSYLNWKNRNGFSQEDIHKVANSRLGWYRRDACEDGSDFGVDPEDYETEEEYSDALDEARSSWRDTCEDGADAGVDPDDYDTEEEYEQALEAAKDAGGGITLSLSVECPALDKLEAIKESDFPNKRRYNAAYYDGNGWWVKL